LPSYTEFRERHFGQLVAYDLPTLPAHYITTLQRYWVAYGPKEEDEKDEDDADEEDRMPDEETMEAIWPRMKAITGDNGFYTGKCGFCDSPNALHFCEYADFKDLKGFFYDDSNGNYYRYRLLAEDDPRHDWGLCQIWENVFGHYGYGVPSEDQISSTDESEASDSRPFAHVIWKKKAFKKAVKRKADVPNTPVL